MCHQLPLHARAAACQKRNLLPHQPNQCQQVNQVLILLLILFITVIDLLLIFSNILSRIYFSEVEPLIPLVNNHGEQLFLTVIK